MTTDTAHPAPCISCGRMDGGEEDPRRHGYCDGCDGLVCLACEVMDDETLDGFCPPCARHVGLTLSAPPAQEAR